MKRTGIALATVLVIGAMAGSAQAATVVNGGFETGDLTGWTTSTTGPGETWFDYDASNLTPPISGSQTGVVLAAPPQGTHAVVTDTNTGGRRTLYQDVALEPIAPGDKLTLSFFVYYQSLSQGLFTPTPETFDRTVGANQQYRVDIVKPSAAFDSVAPADVLTKVFQTETGDPITLAPTKVTTDITPLAGQTVRLRFTEVDNSGIFNASTDDVRIDLDSTPDPRIQFSKPTRQPKLGTATLPLTVTRAGTAVLSGEGVETATVQANGAGTIELPVKSTGSLRKQVKRDRKGSANVTVVFTDSVNGRTATDKRRVHLRQKRR